MKMQGFLLIISLICLTTILSYCTVHAEVMKKKTSTFTIKSGATIMSSSNTTDVYSKSQSACASICLLHDKCYIASFSKESSICRLDTADNCCAATDNAIGWSVLTRNPYIPITFPGSITFGNSKYSIIPEYKEWENAKENCKSLGGKLVELETYEENEFIKDKVMTLNTGVEGYWVGGYNFNQDDDMEWISKPNQVIPFSDMYPGQPNYPTNELCMMIWRDFGFRWGDCPCNYQISYICEFQYK